MDIHTRRAQNVPIRLTVDDSRLSDSERSIIPLLNEAAEAMDAPFWMQNYGDREALLASTADTDTKRYLEWNYGPWDRLRNNEPFIAGVGPKPDGANFYPADMTRDEFEAGAATRPDLKSPYTMVRRDDHGNLVAIPYHRFFDNHVQVAANKLRQAAKHAEEPELKEYLALRADALLTDEYHRSDSAWVGMQANTVDILIGPMEIADRLLGIKTAYAASVLVKDWEWSEQLAQYTELMSRFQANLPVEDTYKQEGPGLDSALAVYDAVCVAGYDRYGIPLGVAWPDDEEIQLQRGTRFLLLKNTMQANFEHILIPLAELLIDPDQLSFVTFEANLTFIMLHELAHGLGIKHTVANNVRVKEALKEQHHAIEEGKADLVALGMMHQLYEWGLMNDDELRAGYITALVRLLYNCDGRHSVARLNVFKEAGAYSRDANTGTYRVNVDAMPAAINSLAAQILRLQGDGDYAGAKAFLDQYGRPDDELKHDMDRIDAARLPLGLVVASDYD